MTRGLRQLFLLMHYAPMYPMNNVGGGKPPTPRTLHYFTGRGRWHSQPDPFGSTSRCPRIFVQVVGVNGTSDHQPGI